MDTPGKLVAFEGALSAACFRDTLASVWMGCSLESKNQASPRPIALTLTHQLCHLLQPVRHANFHHSPDVQGEADLVPPGAPVGTVPTEYNQSTGLERLEILGKMQGIDIFDMRPLDSSRKGVFDIALLQSQTARQRAESIHPNSQYNSQGFGARGLQTRHTSIEKGA